MYELFAYLFYISLIAVLGTAIATFLFKKKLKKYFFISLTIMIFSFIIGQFLDAPASSIKDIIQITSKKSDTGGFETNSKGNFILKGKALKDTTITVKDDLDSDYPQTTKRVKKGNNFKFSFHLGKNTDALNINLHATDNKKDYKRDLDIWNISDSYEDKISKDEASESSKEKKNSVKEANKKKQSSSTSESKKSKVLSTKEESPSSSSATSQSKDSNSVAERTASSDTTTKLHKISKNVKSDTFSGANIQNDVLAFIIKNDKAYNGVGGFKTSQKELLRDIERTIQKYRNNSLAGNGMLFTGAKYELDDGSKSPALTIYFDGTALSILPDFSMSSPDYEREWDDPTRLLDYATNHYIDGMFLRNVVKEKGIYENKHLVKNDEGTPDWIIAVETGDTVVKPIN